MMSTLGLRSDFRDYYDHYFRATLLAEHHYERFASRGLFRWCALRLLEEHGIPVPLHGKVRDFRKIIESYFTELVSGFTPKERRQAYEILAGDDTKVVVYLDPLAHRGESKVLLPLSEAEKYYPECYASLYVESSIGPFTISVRYLRVGNVYEAVVVYQSRDKWRSNYGNVDVWLAYFSARTEEEKRRLYSSGKPAPSGEALSTARAFIVASGIARDQRLFKQVFPLQNRLKAPLLAVDFVFGGWGTLGGFLAVDLNTAPQMEGTGIENVVEPKDVVAAIEKFLNRD